ncbi:ABC transporter ATP-binding protein [bacterium]|nr:ABC transporter ATP-binding protein [candidate division CSSED10-310 bacterium]
MNDRSANPLDKRVVHLRNITKIYRTDALDVPVLHAIDLTVERNEYAAIMGPSGSGKSTLMNILGVLDSPTHGEYFFEGWNIAHRDDFSLSRIRNDRIGFVFQNFSLLPRMTACENVQVPLIYAGVPVRERRRRAEAMLARVGLADRYRHRPGELSGGQKQRVALARALINGPSMILADEPTGNLDSQTSCEIMKLFDSLHADGQTIILVTHEDEIAAHARRTIVLRDGRIIDDRLR